MLDGLFITQHCGVSGAERMGSVSWTSGGPQAPLDASAHPYRCFFCYSSLQHSINNKEPLLNAHASPTPTWVWLEGVYPLSPL